MTRHDARRDPRHHLDFGGVLWNMRWDVARDLEDAHGLPRNVLAETLYGTPTWAALEILG